MDTPRFTPEFKEEALRQITVRDYSVAEVFDRLGDSLSGRVDGTYWPGKVKMSVHESKSE